MFPSLLVLLLSASPPSAVAAEGVVLGSLDNAVVNQVLEKNNDKVRRCYDRARQGGDTLFGWVNVRFVIGEEGTVLQVKTRESTLNAPKTELCIENVVNGLVFPKPPGKKAVVVTYPFTLVPQQDPLPEGFQAGVQACVNWTLKTRTLADSAVIARVQDSAGGERQAQWRVPATVDFSLKGCMEKALEREVPSDQPGTRFYVIDLPNVGGG